MMRGGATLLAVLAVAAGSSRSSTAQPRTAPDAVIGIAHIAFLTSDLSRASRFYGDVLGYGAAPARAESGKRRLVFSVNARQQIIIEEGLPAGQDERLSHVAFEASDLETVRTRLKGGGVAWMPLPPAADASGIRVTDPDGHTIEFVDRNQSASIAAAGSGAISTRILHIGLSVRDAAAADRFYKDLLGFSETWRGGATEGVTSWINMRVPGGTDYLEYMLHSGTPTRQQLGSMHHVALRVPDIQEALELVRARWQSSDGTLGSPRIGRNNRWQLNLFDPDGTRTELMEPFTVR